MACPTTSAPTPVPTPSPTPPPSPAPTPLPVTHLLYLHGFRSSPQSAKARQVAGWVGARHPQVVWWCPQLPPSPAAAMRALTVGIATWPRERMGVIGSSLGGFYAACLAKATGCRSVLLNPAAHPARDLARYIGEQSSWHDPGERFYFEPRYVDELQALEADQTADPVGSPLADPGRCLALIAKGDEVLDWREMHARHGRGRVHLMEGGDHALSDFAGTHLDEVMAFLGLR